MMVEAVVAAVVVAVVEAVEAVVEAVDDFNFFYINYTFFSLYFFDFNILP